MRPDVRGVLPQLRHPYLGAQRIKAVEGGRVRIQLVAEHKHEAPRLAKGVKVHHGSWRDRPIKKNGGVYEHPALEHD